MKDFLHCQWVWAVCGTAGVQVKCHFQVPRFFLLVKQIFHQGTEISVLCRCSKSENLILKRVPWNQWAVRSLRVFREDSAWHNYTLWEQLWYKQPLGTRAARACWATTAQQQQKTLKKTKEQAEKEDFWTVKSGHECTKEKAWAAPGSECLLQVPLPAPSPFSHHCPPQRHQVRIINWYYKKKVWYDHKLRQCFLSGHAENKLLLPPVKPESHLRTWQSKSLAAFHLALKIFSLQMTLALDECPLQKVITLSLNLRLTNLKHWGKNDREEQAQAFYDFSPFPLQVPHQ